MHALPRLVGVAIAVVTTVAAQQPAPGPRAPTSAPPTGPRLDLRGNDRVILIGNTLAERQQYFNHFETALLAGHAGLDLSVRNLGWSGDTITLQPRPLNFGDAPAHLTRQKADVILAFFGANESFDGEAGVAQFEKDLEGYIEKHRAARYNGQSPPRLALVSPIAHEKLPRLVHVDVDARNRELARYTEAMRRVASRLDVPFADVYTPTLAVMAEAKAPLTINGIHLNDDGDRILAGILLEALGLDASPVPAASKGFSSVRALVQEKNRLFFQRFRPLNAEYVVGRRVDPFGSVNFPPEMKQLDSMIAAQERRIWKQVRALAPGPSRPVERRPSSSSPQGGA